MVQYNIQVHLEYSISFVLSRDSRERETETEIETLVVTRILTRESRDTEILSKQGSTEDTATV